MRRKHAREVAAYAEARRIILGRAGGLCERCGCRGPGEFHHRRPRGMGGSRRVDVHCPSGMVFLCRPCHRWAECNRTQALSDGWLVSQWGEPATVPIVTFLGGRVLLSPDGSTVPA